MINQVLFDTLHPVFTPSTRKLLTSILSELPLDVRSSSDPDVHPNIGVYVRSQYFRSLNSREYALVALGADNIPLLEDSYEFTTHHPVGVTVLENYAYAFVTVKNKHIAVGLLLEQPKEDQKVLFE